MDKKIINYKGQEVWCYGDIAEDDNILMVYEDTEDFLDNWSYANNDYFKNWTQVVKELIDSEKFGEIHELSLV
tara:strand:- start:939 stop:1157 length:219 start_codon:yes stop_codon:yes gene_type:complete